jgi:hypothetical protein
MIRRAHLLPAAFVGVSLLVASQALLGSTSSSPTSPSVKSSTTTEPSATETSCAAMKRWAEAYRHTNPTLEELATFDRAHRVAIFNAVSPEVRSALWQDQLHRFAQLPDLTTTQRTLITEGAALMTPALYEREATAAAALESFWNRAKPEFTSPVQRTAWFDIGSVAGAAPQSGASAVFGNCTCRITTGECGSLTCSPASCTTWAGCGVGGVQACNGTCQ